MRHLKYLLTLLMLFAMAGSYGQYYKLDYDITFTPPFLTPPDQNNLEMIYTVGGVEYSIPDFDWTYEENARHEWDSLILHNPITELKIRTSRLTWDIFNQNYQIDNACDGGQWITIYSGNNMQQGFDRTSWTDWGCLDYWNGFDQDRVTVNKLCFYPVYSLSASDTSMLLPVDDSIFFAASVGLASSFYQWQYSVTETNNVPNWVDFPAQYSGNSTVKVSAKTLLGNSVNNFINKTILIRIKKTWNTSCDPLEKKLALTIAKDAPHILSTTAQPTTCFDATDGSATIHFDRNLVPNEKLNIFINRLETTSNTWTSAFTDSNIVTLPGNAYQTPAILMPGTYVVQLLGTYFANGQNATTYTGNLQTHYDTFYINKPPAVAFTKTSADVWCYNGDDGRIDINATGGVGNYKYRLFSPVNGDTTWYNFNAPPQQHITGLAQGTYFVKIKDGNGCVAKTNGGLGAEITDTSVIHQPTDSIHVDMVEQQQPTAYGFTDGYIHIAVYGGTPSPTGTYSYTWTNSANTPVTTDSAYVQGGQYHIWLKHIGADQYTVTIRDHQYANATNKTGCEQIRTYIIEQPLPLKVTLELTSLPSCNKNNTHLDPYQDGILTAHAEGGTPFTNGLPYEYTWKKKDANNNWNVMTAYTDSIASGLEEGWYAVNVKDAHGIQLGQYQGGILIQLTDSTIYLPDHALLTINETVTPVVCNALPTGVILSNVAGGVPPYQYQWSTGANTPDLIGITAGGYFLYATDNKGCHATKAMNVPEPDGYVLTIDTVPPTCHDGCDGSITLNLTGGTQPYTYVWQHTSANSSFVNNLCAGTYTVNISDANNCSFSRMITLNNPPSQEVNMPRDTTLCNGQVATLDIGIDDPAATYNWQSDNGFTAATPIVTLEQAGNYFATITNGKGCIGTDTFTLKRLQMDIDAEILLPTLALAGEEIVLVNVSNPRAEIVEWIMPQQATVLESEDNFVRFMVNDTGSYAVTLRTGVNACREEQTKNVIVISPDNVPGSNTSLPPFIEDLKILPNPNDGHFAVLLKLRESAPADIRIVSVLSSTVVVQRNVSGQKTYNETFDISMLSAGTYLLSVETRKERRTVKIIVQ